MSKLAASLKNRADYPYYDADDNLINTKLRRSPTHLREFFAWK